jgi:FkbM family methyltransferase
MSMLGRIADRFRRNGVEAKFSQDDLGGYCSQYGQDRFVHENLFPGVKNGVFADIGAHDGVTLSNTYFLEKLGWTGIAVEPIPEIFEKLEANRRCITVNGCVGSPAGKRKFRRVSGYPEMLSGLVDEYDQRHEARIAGEIKERGGTSEEIEVDCFDFNALLDEYGIRAVHYLSIDVEGGEFPIIKSIDFARADIRAIGVENNYQDDGIRAYLRKRGFRLHSKVGCDDFFVAA